MARRHQASLAAGSALGTLAFLPAVSGLAAQQLSLHIGLEMTLVAVVVPLLVYGLSPVLRSRPMINPIAGILSLNLVLFAALLPAVVDGSVRDGAVRELAQAAIVLGSALFWWPILAGGRLSPIAKIGALMVASVPPTIPGITLALSHHLFYHSFRAIDDQQTAGLILFGTAKIALVSGTFIILWRMLAPDSEPDDRDDRDRPAEDLPPTAPAWLRQLEGDLPEEAARPRMPVAGGLSR